MMYIIGFLICFSQSYPISLCIAIETVCTYVLTVDERLKELATELVGGDLYFKYLETEE